MAAAPVYGFPYPKLSQNHTDSAAIGPVQRQSLRPSNPTNGDPHLWAAGRGQREDPEKDSCFAKKENADDHQFIRHTR
jgi:hypothetical protein